MKAKEMFEKEGFKQTYFNNDKDSQEIAIRYEKIIPLVSVGEITFICYKNRKYLLIKENSLFPIFFSFHLLLTL